jgi:hypothetical protein
VPETRTVEISIKQIIAAVVILALIGIAVIAFVTRDTWLQIFQSEAAETEEVVAAGSPAAEVGPSEIAEQAALAITAIDYRDRDVWLDRLRPLLTAEAYEQYESYMERMWPSLEEQQIVITPEQVSVADQGIELQAEKYQIRTVDVHIDDSPPSWGEGDYAMHLRLLHVEGGEWRLDSIIDEDELDLLKRLPTRDASQDPEQSTPSVELPTPDPDKEIPAAFAEQFLVVFHAIDYRDMDTWLARMKAMSNMGGYALISSQIYTQFVQIANEKQLTFSFEDFSAEDQGVEMEGETILGQNQVRRVYVEGPQQDSGEVAGDAYLIMIVKDPNASPDDIYGGWRFEEFLNQEMLDYMRGD